MQAVCPECSTLNPMESKFCGNCGTSLESAKIVKPVERADQGVQPATDESTYYSSGGVQVTSTRAVLGAKTYAMANITAVSMTHLPPKRLLGILLMVLGISAIIGGFGRPGSLAIYAGIGAFAITLGLGWLVQKHKYIVVIESASGKSNALTSTDKSRTQKIVSAINQAIIERG